MSKVSVLFSAFRGRLIALVLILNALLIPLILTFEPSFTAQATLLLRRPIAATSYVAVPTAPDDNDRYVQDRLLAIESPSFVERVRSKSTRIGFDWKLKAEPVPRTNVVKLAVSSRTSNQATEALTAVVDLLLEDSNGAAQALVEKRESEIADEREEALQQIIDAESLLSSTQLAVQSRGLLTRELALGRYDRLSRELEVVRATSAYNAAATTVIDPPALIVVSPLARYSTLILSIVLVFLAAWAMLVALELARPRMHYTAQITSAPGRVVFGRPRDASRLPWLVGNAIEDLLEDEPRAERRVTATAFEKSLLVSLSNDLPYSVMAISDLWASDRLTDPNSVVVLAARRHKTRVAVVEETLGDLRGTPTVVILYK